MSTSDPVAAYLKDVPHVRYTREEEASLWWRMKRGPKKNRRAARDQLILSQLFWAANLASKYQGQSMPYEDLLGIANRTLVEKVEDFDPTRGRLTTFLAVPIRQALERAVYEHRSIIRVPSYVRSCENTRLREQAARVANIRSVDRPMENCHEFQQEGGTPPRHLLPDPNNDGPFDFDGEERMEQAKAVRDAIKKLPQQERIVLEMRLAGDKLAEIAEQLGVSKQRVQQVEQHARTRLINMFLAPAESEEASA